MSSAAESRFLAIENATCAKCGVLLNKEERMRRVPTTMVVVFGCVSMLELQSHAQTTESKTKIKTEDAKTMTFSDLLVPEKVQWQEHVGHKVEVTGVLIPAGKGDAKIETRTKTAGTEEKTKTEVDKGPVPQLKVISVKTLADRCS